jgi:hypothetical protein
VRASRQIGWHGTNHCATAAIIDGTRTRRSLATLSASSPDAVAGKPQATPAVRLEGFVLILFSVVPVWLAQRISGAETAAGARL